MLSATNQHRLHRDTLPRESLPYMVNSLGSILLADPGAKQEDTLRSQAHVYDEALKPSTATSPSTRSAVRTLSLFMAVITAAAFGIGQLP